MHFLAGGDAAFTRFIGVAANAHRLLERGDVDDFVRFHERVVKLVGMCRNRVRRAAYATSKNMLVRLAGRPLPVWPCASCSRSTIFVCYDMHHDIFFSILLAVLGRNCCDVWQFCRPSKRRCVLFSVVGVYPYQVGLIREVDMQV